MLMESQEINDLLEKYWTGETTLDEEAQLRRYFQEQEPPAHLRPVAALFRHYEAPPQLGDDFDAQLEAKLKKEEAPVVSMAPRWLKVAAAVAILVTGALWMKYSEVADTPASAPVAAVTTDTYEDPEQAYEEAKQALLLVSSLMNEGTAHLTNLEEFNAAQQVVKEPRGSAN